MPAAPTAALKSTPAARANLAQTEQKLRQLVQAEPRRVDGWYQLGLLYLRQKRPDAAAECLARAIELDPEQPLFHHHLADCHQALGHGQEAVAGFAEVVRLKPECAEAYNNLGIAQARIGRREQAAASFDRAVALKPDFPEAHNNRANVLIESGKLDDAVGHFQRALALHPDYAEAHNNLGFALARLGRRDEAIASLRAAVRLRPGYAEALFNLATAYRDHGRLSEAIEAYQQTIAAKAEHVEARMQLGAVLVRLGRLDEAAAALHQCLLFRPDSADIYNNLGIILVQQNRLQEAVAAFRQATRVKPDFPEAVNNLGNALLRLQQIDEAIACFREAIELRDGYAQPHANLGAAMLQEGRAEEAVGHYENALRRKPDFADAHYGLGNALRALKRPEEAVTSYRRALALQPDNAGALLNLGAALAELGQLDEAVVLYEDLLKQRPDLAEAYSSLGVTRLHQDRPHDALACYEQALKLKPEEPDFHLNRALTLMSLGDYERGLPEYEWRWRSKRAMPRPLPQPTWDGSPLPHGTILLYAEQGLGDTLQFVRYAALVKQRVDKVLLECPGPLRNLLAGCPGVDAVVDATAPLPPFDVQAPLLSLPRLLGTTVAKIPAEIPYLLADTALRSRWRRDLDPNSVCKVGISWQGNPQYPGDRFRSIKLTQFQPLAGVPGVQLVSLQKGPGIEQLENLNGEFTVTDLGSRLSADFRDSAALVAELDLVIAVDTAVAHLAGGLGVPVWVLLPFNADWRWLRGREDSPWYPSARLFRQERWGDWDGVFSRVVAALRERVQAPRPRTVLAEIGGAEFIERIALLELQGMESDASQRAHRALDELRRRSLPWSDALARQAATLKQALASLADIEKQMQKVDSKKGSGARATALVQAFVHARNERSAALAALTDLLQGPKLH